MCAKYLSQPEPRINHTAIKLNCDYCGMIYWESRSRALKKKRHFCCQKCYSNFCTELLPINEHNAYGKGLGQEEREKRMRVRAQANHAIRDKKIKRLSCCVCGSEENIEKHHPDYNKPLDIIWLCKKHHHELHHGKK
jgi:protein-arginine kinase activator protein McsA